LVENAVPAGTDAALTDAVFGEFCTYYAAHSADTTAPYAGIPALLEKLSRSGVKMAIVSNKADFAVQDLVMRYFGEVIPVSVGAREDMPKKPAPDMVEYALSLLGVAKAEAAYVGDSEVDVLTARNTGMDCLAVNWGFRSAQTLREAGAERIFSTPQELMETILG
jgi:phosphoglycolate phosphatase